MQYWAYARVSTKKQKRGQTIKEQTRPLAKFLYNHGYHTQNSIRTHLYHEQYTGTTMKRPKFQKMLQHVKSYDEIVFAKLSRMSRTLDGADHFITKYCKPNHIKIHILDGGWNIDPNTSMGRLQMHLFLSFVEFDHDMVIERMNQGKVQAKMNGNPNWNGGISPRFTGKHKEHYLAMYHYAKKHTLGQTAKVFNTSKRTVGRVRHDGNIYSKSKQKYLSKYINK